MKSEDEASAAPDSKAPLFTTTRWSKVVEAQRTGNLDFLWEVYQRPLLQLARWYLARRGAANHAICTPDDLVNDFFTSKFEKLIQQADPEKGRLRSFLGSSLIRAISSCLKREPLQSGELIDEEDPTTSDAAERRLDLLFWAELFEQAFLDLREQFYREAKDKEVLREMLDLVILRRRSYQAVAEARGINVDWVKNSQRKFKSNLRKVVRDRLHAVVFAEETAKARARTPDGPIVLDERLIQDRIDEELKELNRLETEGVRWFELIEEPFWDQLCGWKPSSEQDPPSPSR